MTDSTIPDASTNVGRRALLKMGGIEEVSLKQQCIERLRTCNHITMTSDGKRYRCVSIPTISGSVLQEFKNKGFSVYEGFFNDFLCYEPPTD